MSTKPASADASPKPLSSKKKTPIGLGLRALSAITGSDLVNKYDLNKQLTWTSYNASKTGFKALGVANRVFQQVAGGGKAARPARAKSDLFDLTPEEDQKLIVETVKEFADEVLRPAALEADAAVAAPQSILDRSAELGVTLINVPEEFEGAAAERNAITNALVAEALAYGDLGLALPILAPSAVAIALGEWGTDGQQKTYLPSFAEDKAPQSAFVIAEPQPLFNPFDLKTKAVRTPSGFKLSGVKALVPAAGSSELFIIGAQLEGRPALFIVESGNRGLTVEGDPSMGLRAAGIGRINLDNVVVPESALLGDPDPQARENNYTESVRLARIAWASVAAGVGQAVLDYVIPYVNGREAFGEPISHRQAVAFMVANIAIELDGIRLVALRGASRAAQGLPFAREAALARRLASEKGMQIGLDGVQLLGGHGFTKEHPVERWYRDLRAVGVAEGVILV
ncbi:acyl-CoA dehydrogenase family protein [Segniliparus rugosus]|uniref:Butyryl-CoA dehydrogenase n=1 Tax=Segniliparus rugosus (strain ATCC BAA-974 / DSM 45345 / CCUG 50838 / CIP 108380 / JCM 13579 / CDC 945) TaxID=679197 RepID=E5XNZ8_SEGRC|nr:acyl-CoA dehydrogenase family protein [Segniliparus rugosus]EFV13937.1 hypothetical protein HMPREF9336_01219 [Segniliparus rugosus ATCC BAA-974]